METLSAIAKRTSIREFSDKVIPKDKIKTIIDAARHAPTARGLEPWEFVVVQNKKTLRALGEVCDSGKFIQAANACILVFCQDTKYYLEDGCAATENMLLAATDLGIASCWVAGDKKPYVQKVKEIVGAAAALNLVSLVALGYAKSEQPPHKRRGITEILHWEHFNHGHNGTD